MKKKVNKDTKLCISISKNPGNSGTTIHNFLYDKYDLNFLYKSFEVDDLKSAMCGIKGLGIAGCSVSMPFKKDVVDYLDEIDDNAKILGVVNTIVNNNNNMSGFNTDVFGAFMTIKNLLSYLSFIPNVTVVGAGATSRSVILALKKLGIVEVNVLNRSRKNALKLLDFVNDLNMTAFILDDLCEIPENTLLINCSSIGMKNNDIFPINNIDLLRCVLVFDVVNKETDLIQRSKLYKIECLNGKMMAVYQTLKQFELYTKLTIDIEKEKVNVWNLI